MYIVFAVNEFGECQKGGYENTEAGDGGEANQ